MGAEELSSVDLFAGAGGLMLGLQWAGFDALVANDNWSPAIDTLGHNFGSARVSPDDIRGLSAADVLALTDGVTPLLVAGGPPCQGFTSAGARRASDHRNTLVGEFARMVAELQPRWFLFENVEGFLTMSGGSFVIDLLDGVLDAGYQVRLRKVNVANYGVPQLRKRVIAIGSLGADPGFPIHRIMLSARLERNGNALQLCPLPRQLLTPLSNWTCRPPPPTTKRFRAT